MPAAVIPARNTPDLGVAGDREGRVRRELGFWSLTGVAVGGMIGSGWLFGAYTAAGVAGPAAVLAWPLAGVALALVGMVLAHLGATRPQVGGMVRWPGQACGPLVGTIVAWAVLLSVCSALAAEASAIVQYAGRYVSGLSQGDALTGRGLLLAGAVLAGLVAVNWFGVRLFARFNLAVTVIKVGVPALTLVALACSGLHPHNLTAVGGFAPHGFSAALSAVAGAGVIYTMNGFATPVELSGEARDPRRDLPRAVLIAICFVALLYTLLQLVFLLVLPPAMLSHGWSGIDLNSPFGQLTVILGLGWLSSLIYIDAVVSPAGAANVFVASGARETYAVARSGVLPAFFAVIKPGAGVPRRALTGNFVVSLLFLAPFHGWQQLVTVVGVLSLLTYSACAVAAGRWQAQESAGRRTTPIAWLAPATFVVATELVYWAGWHQLRVALPLAALAVVLFAVRRPAALRTEFRRGYWLVVYLLVLFATSAIGTFGGLSWLPAPWDSVLPALASVVVYLRAVCVEPE